jgi:CarD family transcriptional regulator
MFDVGDLAVYPAHGVGVIEKIESQEISGCRQEFYVMRILDNDMIIMIPKNNVNNVGLREIIGEGEVRKLYTILKKKDVEKDLSFIKRNMLDTARSLLVKEISLAKNIKEEQVEEDLERIFS